MKTFLIASILFLLAFNSMGQGFVDTDNQWNVLNELNFGGYDTEIYKISGDTVIGGKTYNYMMASTDSMQYWFNAGLLREESNKVYYLPGNGNPEGLLYDFNLKTGDTTHIISAWMWEAREFICTAVDSIKINGIYQNRWKFDFPFSEWIEGIGSTDGPLNCGASTFVSDLYFTLLCFHRNDSLLYMAPGGSDCYLTNVGLNELSETKEQVTLSPNPARTQTRLCAENPEKFVSSQINIISPSGKTISRIGWNGETRSIDLSALPKGVYLVQIQGSGVYAVTKLLVE